MSALGRQALRFLTVGGGATLVHVTAALIFNGLAGLPPLSANFLAFLVAWTLSYWGNWRWTFDASSAHRSAMPKFFVVSIVLFGINQAIVYVAAVRFGRPFWAALLIVAAVIPAAGFLASRLWAFLPRQRRA